MVADDICGPSSRALLHAVRKNLCCPICLDVYAEPVALPCAHIFCRACLQRALERCLVCPLCKASITARSLTPLPTLTALIDLAHAVAKKAGVADITDSQVAFPSFPASPALHPSPLATVDRSIIPTVSVAGGNRGDDEVGLAMLTATSDLTPWRLLTGDGMGSSLMPLHKRPRSSHRHLVSSISSSSLSSSSNTSTSSDSTGTTSPTSLQSTSSSSSSSSPSMPEHDESAKTKITTRVEPQRRVSKKHDDDDDDDDDDAHPCALCHLDIYDRACMRSFLNGVAAHDPTCDVKRLRQQSEESLQALLGSLCGPFLLRSSDATKRKKHARRESEVGSWAHYSCLLWSPEVQLDDGRLLNIERAISRGRKLRCFACGKFGATIGCRVGSCRKSFHYPCAAFSGPGMCRLSSTHDDLSLLCAKHCPHHTEGYGVKGESGPRTQSTARSNTS